MRKCFRFLFPATVGGLAAVSFAGLSGSYVVPLEHNAIQYEKTAVDDPVYRLSRAIAAGEAKLPFDPQFGYLPAVLKALHVPVESQVLVFSKTSFQATRISPRMPRALYYNDAVEVGFVRGGDVVEFAAQDPRQGVIFYTLDQVESPRPRIERRDTCLQCHASGGTLGVPGLMVRSIYPEPSGMPLFHAGGFVTDHRSPLDQRWGGWYVTGTHGKQHHMGNAIVPNPDKPEELETEGTQNLTTLRGKIDTAAYLSPHSDIVALMVLEHQTHMTNLITRVGFETRMALHDQVAMNKALERPLDELSESTQHRIQSAVDEMVEYMLFAEETQLKDPIEGTSGFAKRFATEGPRDRAGRSLRDFDLATRMFRYPLTYMIYSEAFDQMPEEAKGRIYQRLWDVLTAKDHSTKFARLTEADRRAIIEILLDTKGDLPPYWRAGQEQPIGG